MNFNFTRLDMVHVFNSINCWLENEHTSSKEAALVLWSCTLRIGLIIVIAGITCPVFYIYV